MTTASQKILRLEDVLAAAQVGETDDWEFKSAKGGFPGSLWETYSAMANSTGGIIALGVTEKNGSVSLDGLAPAQIDKYKKTLWNSANDRGVVNRNMLASADVTTTSVAGGELLLIRVPQASRKERPVYKGQNPFGGTYKRRHEGDYKCSDEEVRRMFADANDTPADSRILHGLTFRDLDGASLRAYRNRVSSTKPSHPWLSLDDAQLLEKLGAWRKDQEGEGPTVAGILMFGRHQSIVGPDVVPSYMVDFRDYRGRTTPQDRWTDRIFPDGTWEANLFQFYQRCLPKLISDLRVPFALKNGQRVEDTPVHVALREALVNALIHADYAVGGGIVIERYEQEYRFANPGTLLVSEEQLREGGVSECRNKSLQRMFMLMGGGEQAGSGYARIQAGWQSQHWRAPRLSTQQGPDRIRLNMPMVSLMPHEVFAELRRIIGLPFDSLSEKERLALATALMEDEVTNSRMQDLLSDHPVDITKILRGLVNKGFLVGEGSGRWSKYVLPSRLDGNFDLFALPHPSHNPTPDPSPHKGGVAPTEAEMMAIAAPIRAKRSADRSLVEQAIMALCQNQFLTPQRLADLLGRTSAKLRENYLTPMVRDGRLERLYPQTPGKRDQAYRTKVG